MARASSKRNVQCYLCGHALEVSALTLSTNCPKCNKAIKVEDVTVKSYLPVNDLQTCGKIVITKKGRVAAKIIQSGGGIECDGVMEAAVASESSVTLSKNASWKGKALTTTRLVIEEGAKLNGMVTVSPYHAPAKKGK